MVALVSTVLSLWEFICVLGNGQAFPLILKPQTQSNHECTFIYKKEKQAKLHLTDGSVLPLLVRLFKGHDLLE